MSEKRDHLHDYRLSWNYADNGISWLEPTTDGNLRCGGCYRDPSGPGHKTLVEVRPTWWCSSACAKATA